MPTHSWKDGHVLSTPPKCELMHKVVGESPVPRNPRESGSLCSLPGEADADGTLREVLSESLLSICMSTHLPSGLIIVEPSLIYLSPPPHTHRTLYYVQVVGVQKLTRFRTCPWRILQTSWREKQAELERRAGYRKSDKAAEWVTFEFCRGCKICLWTITLTDVNSMV